MDLVAAKNAIPVGRFKAGCHSPSLSPSWTGEAASWLGWGSIGDVNVKLARCETACGSKEGSIIE